MNRLNWPKSYVGEDKLFQLDLIFQRNEFKSNSDYFVRINYKNPKDSYETRCALGLYSSDTFSDSVLQELTQLSWEFLITDNDNIIYPYENPKDSYETAVNWNHRSKIKVDLDNKFKHVFRNNGKIKRREGEKERFFSRCSSFSGT